MKVFITALTLSILCVAGVQAESTMMSESTTTTTTHSSMSGSSHSRRGLFGIKRRAKRRQDRRSHRRSGMHHSSMSSSYSSAACPTCGKSGVRAVPAPPTTEAPGASIRPIKKEAAINAST